MNLTRISYFLKAANTLNFTEAARQLYVSQPALSRQISLLEVEIGVRLFDRSSKPLKMTPAGETLAREFARLGLDRLTAEVEAAIDLARASDAALKQNLSIGYAYFLYQELDLGSRLASFRATHPEISISLSCHGYRTLKAKLQAGSLDACILRIFNHETIPGVEMLHLARRMPHIVVPAGSPLAGQQQIALADLAGVQLILLDNSADALLDRSVAEKLKARGIATSVRYVPNIETILDHVEMGMGVSLLDIGPDADRHGRVRFIPCPELEPYDLVCAWRRLSSSDSLKKWIDYLTADIVES